MFPMSVEVEHIKKVLKQYWGYDAFRDLQEDIILSVMNGRDTLALMPTGGGKSLCYQVPALALDGLTLVVSPLIALMKDQVERLKSLGVRATALHSGQSRYEQERLLDNAVNGGIKLLYVSPERLTSSRFMERLEFMEVALIAVDEAHCISQWGFDFRPSYTRLSILRSALPHTPILALTATATQVVVQDITEQLEFGQNASVFQAPMRRDNLSFHVVQSREKWHELRKSLKRYPGSSIIYTRSRKKTTRIARDLEHEGFEATNYHAGLSHEVRKKRQEDWIRGETPIMVATNAFGMGIDKADVRLVVHVDIPDSLEAYTQEAGRAGRDGKDATAMLLFHQGDLSFGGQQIERSHLPPEVVKRIYEALSNYYQLAIGSLPEEQFSFNIAEFARTYSFSVLDVHHALNILEKEGWLLLNDAVKKSATVQVISEEQDVSVFLQKKGRRSELLHCLLRLYEGIYFQKRNLDWDAIKRLTGSTFSEIRDDLNYLQQINLIAFEASGEQPAIRFLKARVSTDNLDLDWKLYRILKSRALDRWDQVNDYLLTNDCRSAFLERYFTDTGVECGICDNCQAKKASTNQDLRQRLIDTLNANPVSASELLHQFASDDERAVRAILDDLSAREYIQFADGKFQWKA